MPLPVLSQPEPISELVSLCQSMNSPVVSIAELPVGPASAAIAIHANPSGVSHVTVAVRCQRTEEVVLFGSPEDPEQQGNGFSERAALHWAEGLGFLFDEELCEPADAGSADDIEKGVRNERAQQIWSEFVCTADSVPESSAQDSPDLGARPSPAAMLSKFRWEHRVVTEASPA